MSRSKLLTGVGATGQGVGEVVAACQVDVRGGESELGDLHGGGRAIVAGHPEHLDAEGFDLGLGGGGDRFGPAQHEHLLDVEGVLEGGLQAAAGSGPSRGRI